MEKSVQEESQRTRSGSRSKMRKQVSTSTNSEMKVEWCLRLRLREPPPARAAGRHRQLALARDMTCRRRGLGCPPVLLTLPRPEGRVYMQSCVCPINEGAPLRPPAPSPSQPRHPAHTNVIQGESATPHMANIGGGWHLLLTGRGWAGDHLQALWLTHGTLQCPGANGSSPIGIALQ